MWEITKNLVIVLTLILEVVYAEHLASGPGDCLENEDFFRYYNGCEVTCEMPHPAPNWHCVHAPFPECACKKGFYRDRETKRCVSLRDCRQPLEKERRLFSNYV